MIELIDKGSKTRDSPTQFRRYSYRQSTSVERKSKYFLLVNHIQVSCSSLDDFFGASPIAQLIFLSLEIEAIKAFDIIYAYYE